MDLPDRTKEQCPGRKYRAKTKKPVDNNALVRNAKSNHAVLTLLGARSTNHSKSSVWNELVINLAMSNESELVL